MNDFMVKALAWAQMAGEQLLALPQTAHMTLNRPKPSSPGIFRGVHLLDVTWKQVHEYSDGSATPRVLKSLILQKSIALCLSSSF